MKKLRLILLNILSVIFLFSGAASSFPNESIYIDGDRYILTFFDEFNSDILNNSKWEPCPPMERQDVGGRWEPSMAELDGKGHLVISADISDGVPVSGAIRSKGRFEQTEGYFEIRCRLQSSAGFWSAFWLMCDGANSVGNGARDGAEIDIFEAYDTENKLICHALHWDGYEEQHKKTGITHAAPDCYDGEFHTFSLLWTDKSYVFYIDGKEYYRLSEGDESYPGASKAAAYIKISAEFGSWAGEYDESTLPDCFETDYVRVYKKAAESKPIKFKHLTKLLKSGILNFQAD